ncbi:DNA cytosine methyltransferase [Idiomarina abyssalis]|uniref:DNA cytosine methyltransferase n=1 Tax=Idiomarina abyssalis TaxID=86102 RepID=UPI003A8CB152
MFKSIDLFAGGGGLSEGMKQAGFEIISAVENNPYAAETFKANHKNTVMFENDIRFVSGKEILKRTGIKKGELDLLAGCPPCQGFSSLTRKYKREDSRNTLIAEVARLVRETMPKAIMIENVPGLMKRGEPFLKGFLKDIESMGYISNFDVLQVADYGVPQDRKRFVLLAGLGFEIEIPKPTHSKKGCEKTTPWVNVKTALESLEKPVLLSEANSNGGGKQYNWNVTRNMAPINIERLKHLKPGAPRYDIPDHLRPNCHKGNNKGFANVYGRMSYESVSPTITCGCTVLSKGRFGHPTELRTISVREAARLQTFPDSFKFESDYIDHVCQIIGNALPCEFARIMSESCRETIQRNTFGFRQSG